MQSFPEFFRTATRNLPYPYQERLAAQPIANRIMRVPTGAGKTAAVVLSWLHRLGEGVPDAPRRMAYCLPMRVLVEQTMEQARKWISALKLPVGVATLMGGEVEEEWEIRPERRCIIVGTQDMLFSRALNRGYAMSRYRWPAHFGLLNNDCLWVCDEVQLMGDGLATSAQLAAFRERFGTFGNCPTIWMSATVDPKMLHTPDMLDAPPDFELREEDFARKDLNDRLTARKLLEKAPDDCNTAQGLAHFLAERHGRGTQTIAVVNTVARAREVFDQLRRLVGNTIPCHLLHSRFRPSEKRSWTEIFKPEIPREGRILIATQVIEAGVDISSSLLITDLAPWSSMVQRFGRCNRAGECDTAHVFWIDTRPKVEPYEADELERAGEIVKNLTSASPCDLSVQAPDYEPTHVLRKQDLVDLFDTTPDLSGYDLDVSRFIRSEQDRDVLLAWRASDPGLHFRGSDAAAPLKPVWRAATIASAYIFPRQRCRGPIEARLRLRCSGCKADFRGSDAAAPLKRARLSALPSNPSYFRGSDAAAPLKHLIKLPVDGAVSDFRGSDAAAPLKPDELREKALHFRAFPRQRCRGPIEALCLKAGQAPRFHFRGSDAAAPLKLSAARVKPRDFPHFRGSDAAAPLKPDSKPGGVLSVQHFRGSDAAAPLKPHSLALAHRRPPGFPRQRCRGPIEAW